MARVESLVTSLALCMRVDLLLFAAARTALHMFIQDKSALPREKDVLRSVKAST